ncbi:MAG: tetratricopeptide repeat protein [Treponema sp.]|jgi:tetratricopeptide (TPR) repeat protein|nr:tetratricopeptide repeat protein [Treponema sp.]
MKKQTKVLWGILTIALIFGLLGCTSLSMLSDIANTAVKEKETAETHFERGEEFAEQEKWQDAVSEYTKAIELNPGFAAAYRERAFSLIKSSNGRGIREKAEADCNKAIELDPQNFIPYYYRGAIYGDWGDDEAYTNAFGYSTNNIGTSDITRLTKAVKYYDDALSDFSKALELSPNNQQVPTLIAHVKTRKEASESALTSSTAQRQATEQTNRYDPSKFTVVPSNFKPADYTKVDLFKAASDARNLQVVLNKQEAALSQLQSGILGGLGGSYILQYVSDLTFVRQNGTDITFSSDDNAITQIMTIDQRSGLQAGQKVRVYYTIMRAPLITWDVVAIERR